ncbi:MAG: DUF4126 domain-containing protein [Acidobacteria bacterium]|nr:DUF4126 domain-containing protein [Acidobacteriota bacterium]
MNQDLLWALLLSWGAGINLYLTVLLAGIVGRMQWAPLPRHLGFLASDWFLALAGAMFLIEFVIDKVPYLDSFWDSIHTFIRVPAAALLALGATLGVPQPGALLMTPAGTLLSFLSHGAKSSIRLALNSTPEPFTNWFVSLLEDALVTLAYFLLLKHPALLVALVGIATVAATLTLYLLIRIFEGLFQFSTPSQLRRANWRLGSRGS